MRVNGSGACSKQVQFWQEGVHWPSMGPVGKSGDIQMVLSTRIRGDEAS